MEMPRHSEVRSLAWVMQPPIHDRERIYTLSLFSPTKNCKLPLRATGNYRRLLSCGQKLVMWVAQRSHPSSLYPVPSTGSGENCPLCQALLRPRSGEDHGIKPVPASAPLGPAVPGRAARASVLVGNSPCSFSGPFCFPPPQLDGQLRDLAGRLPVAWELGQLLSHSPRLSRPDSASFANPSLPFFLPRVPNGLVFSLRESECHLYTYLAVLCVFFCPA